MKASRMFLALMLAGFAASAAMADGKDPLISVRRVDPAPIAITSPHQTFLIFFVAGSSPVFDFAFQNDTGVTLTSLTLDLAHGLTYNCDPTFLSADIFSSCGTSPGPLGSTIISFSGTGGIFTGLDASSCIGSNSDNNGHDGDGDFDDETCTGGIFSIEFSGLTPGEVVLGTGTVATPEPMTAVLLFSGLAGLAGFRKRRLA